MEVKETFIYILFDPREPDVVRYVGKTVNVYGRMRSHKSAANRGGTDYVYNWIRKLAHEGVSFSYSIIEVVVQGDWEERERHWIKYYRDGGHPLANCTTGGGGVLGWVPSDETRRKIGEANKGNNYHAGHVHSESARRKIGETHKGNTYRAGNVVSEETKHKIREARLGKPQTRPVGHTGFRYVTMDKRRGNYCVCIPYLAYSKSGIKTAEEARFIVQEYIAQTELLMYWRV